MADPFFVTVSIISVTIFALQSVKELLAPIETIRDAPETAVRINKDLEAVVAVQDSLQKAVEGKTLASDVVQILQPERERPSSGKELLGGMCEFSQNYFSLDATLHRDKNLLAG